MRNIIKYLCVLLALVCPLYLHTVVRGAAAYTISDYQIRIDVDKSALMQVEEHMNIRDCSELAFTKVILQNYTYDADQDGVAETYAYEISDVEVSGAQASLHYENGQHLIRMTLDNQEAQIILRYRVRLRRYNSQDFNIFRYQLISPNHEAVIENFHASITFPNTPDTAFDVYKSDDSTPEGNRFPAHINNKTLEINSMEELHPHEGVMIHANLRNFFFTYSNPITYHLFFTIFSIIMVMGTYYFIIKGKRLGKKQVYRHRLALQDVPLGSYGYILDGIVDDADIISILIDWANNGNIQIRNENQTVSLVLIQELSPHAPNYEKDLFNLLFTNYTLVTVDQLRTRQLYPRIKRIEQAIHHALERNKKSVIYANSSYPAQLSAALLIPLPLSLIMLACRYGLEYDLMASLPYALTTAAIIYCNLLPWIWIGKHRYRLTKSVHDVYRILTMLINFICGALLYHYLLTNQTPVVYIAINYVLTVLFTCILIFMERRTVYGRNQRKQLLALRQFIRDVRSDQLTRYLSEDPYYFEKLLPYAYIFDITDIWGKKFATIPLQAPIWYFHAKADMQSTIYWMRSLEEALEAIRSSLYVGMKPKQGIASSHHTPKGRH